MPFIEEIIVQGPHVFKVFGKISFVWIQFFKNFGNKKRKTQLKEHHRYGSYQLIFIVAVFQNEFVPKAQDGHSVQCSVHKPLAGWFSVQKQAQRVKKSNNSRVSSAILSKP